MTSTKNSTTSKQQSIAQAMSSPAIRRALNGLVGCAEGGWGDTQQALRHLADALPIRQLRSYTRAELVSAALIVDAAGRYRWRE